MFTEPESLAVQHLQIKVRRGGADQSTGGRAAAVSFRDIPVGFGGRGSDPAVEGGFGVLRERSSDPCFAEGVCGNLAAAQQFRADAELPAIGPVNGRCQAIAVGQQQSQRFVGSGVFQHEAAVVVCRGLAGVFGVAGCGCLQANDGGDAAAVQTQFFKPGLENHLFGIETDQSTAKHVAVGCNQGVCGRSLATEARNGQSRSTSLLFDELPN